MSGGISEYHLQRMTSREDAVIDSDRQCINCGYSLRGLIMSGACPECGTAVRKQYAPDESLSDMPVTLVRRFIIGLWMCTIALLGVIALGLGIVLDLGFADLLRFLLLAITLGWCGGAWIVTPALPEASAQQYGFGRSNRLRVAARFAQVLWPLEAAVLMSIDIVNQGAFEDALASLSIALLIGGMGGVVLFALQMQRLAQWMRDDFAESVLQWTIWGMPIMTLIFLIPLPSTLALGAVVILVLWVVMTISLPVALWSLSRSAVYAAVHAASAHQRNERRAAELYAAETQRQAATHQSPRSHQTQQTQQPQQRPAQQRRAQQRSFPE